MGTIGLLFYRYAIEMDEASREEINAERIEKHHTIYALVGGTL
jgi:hypothetical protein